MSVLHREEATLEDVTDAELRETVTLAGATRYFSTILHGAEVDYDEFVSETAEIVDHVETQRIEAGAD